MMESYWVLGGTPPKAFKSPYPPEEQKIRHWGYVDGNLGRRDRGAGLPRRRCAQLVRRRASGEAPSARGGLRYKIAYGDWDSDHHHITYYYPNGIEGWLLSIKHTGRIPRREGAVLLLEGHAGDRADLLQDGTARYPARRYKNADDLGDRSLIEKGESKREITIDAVEAFFTSIWSRKPYSMATDRR